MKQEILTDIGELDRYLLKIGKIFSINDLLYTNYDKQKISSYYKNSSFGYKYFHSKKGAVHMAINYDGVFSEDGYLTQVKEISRIFNSMKPSLVLELGCGKGFNSIYLAKLFSETYFYGIDITQNHLSIAIKSSKNLKNLTFSEGDFHDLNFKSETIDVVFEIESICHALDQRKVLKSVYDVMKWGGRYILYEGFRKDNFNNLSNNLKVSSQLTEKSMAINSSIEIQEWLKLVKDIGFKVQSCDDISEAIMPNLCRFQRMARGFYKYRFLSKLFLTLLPKEMVLNSIAGLLMPFNIRNGAHGYYKIILEK